MGWWTDHVVPRLTDSALAAPEIGALRRVACAPLTGRLLEVGFGSGLNLPHLGPEVTGVDAVEPSDVGWARSESRRRDFPVPVRRIGLDGQEINAPDATYDSALVTFSLCTIDDPARALTQIHRLLRPGGVLAFLEHGLSPEPGTARWQRRLDPLQRTLCGGCHLSRDIPGLLTGAGFEIHSLEERVLLPGPAFARPWAYGFVGQAVRAEPARDPDRRRPPPPEGH
ncbi:class I SAM-dependent methyltransferase [Nocardioides gilvus]|uniref:class I SAM-dependent methyltransferase n=1 Tax=Nocardioides gilvus TaxID=1735589 RepID=UPI000D74CE25|nr:class I SAM-dependent methyltransferase [Nocardioides gilvus]